MTPLGLKFKGRLVVILCRTVQPFLTDAQKIEAVERLRRNYELLLKGEA
jgi:hypothetical protein